MCVRVRGEARAEAMAWGRARAGRGACRRPEPERHFLAASASPRALLRGELDWASSGAASRPRRGAEADTSGQGASRRSCPPPVVDK